MSRRICSSAARPARPRLGADGKHTGDCLSFWFRWRLRRSAGCGPSARISAAAGSRRRTCHPVCPRRPRPVFGARFWLEQQGRISSPWSAALRRHRGGLHARAGWRRGANASTPVRMCLGDSTMITSVTISGGDGSCIRTVAQSRQARHGAHRSRREVHFRLTRAGHGRWSRATRRRQRRAW